MTSEQSTTRRYFKDSAANASRSLVAALVVVLTNRWIINALGKESFSLWTIAVSIGAYVSFAESGIGTSVVRFVAPDRTGSSPDTRSFLANSLLFASAVGAVVVGILMALVMGTSMLFGDAPTSRLGDVRVAAWFCIGAGFFSLWNSVSTGYFAARHQSATAALISIGVSAVNVAAVYWACRSYGSLRSLGVVTLGVATIQVFALMTVALRRSKVRINDFRIDPTRLRTIFSHCLGTGWWSLSMLLISGLDIIIVARVDFPLVGSYAIAARLVLLVLTLTGAATAPIMSMAARTAATGDRAMVTALLVRSSRLMNVANALLTGGLFVAAPAVVRLFADESYVTTSSTLLRLLLVGNFIRQTGGVLGVVMVATGEHRKAFVPPIAEGLTNVGMSIGLGMVIGAKGVAIGTIIGSVVSLVFYSLRVFPRFEAFELSPKTFFSACVAPAALVLVPAIVAMPFAQSSGFGRSALVTAAAMGAAIALAWRFGITSNERESVRQRLG